MKVTLDALGVRPKKSLSQNFLTDRNIVRKLVESADIQEGDLVLEVGPGTGAITEALLERGARVIAVEKDPALARALARFPCEIHCQDILQFPLEEHLASRAKVVANLPYHISSPILTRMVPHRELFSTLTVIVQKEVALRYVAKVGSADYSSISVYLQFFSEVRPLFSISPSCFYPKPKIESAAISLTLKKPPLAHWEPFFALVRRAFNQKRKMLRSSLKGVYPNIKEALAAAGLPERVRPQELSLEDYLKLHREINNEVDDLFF